ncbi:hypothetical protein [Polyangium sorediatum]|uniref:DNA-directed RNA polymerase n=1 Tax=Polyangium sorediatum TaxID=889274 RepID=A0ABT6NJZ2_9BACT|nr:hypothetical protein [Polyangium sorediatum]MDI1428635.1 hypothetical protein [Polyangium sorediatum]
MSLRDRFFSPSDVVADLQWVQKNLLDPAAPDDIRSFGRVTSGDLLRRWSNSRRRPVRDGIFCQCIFGPVSLFRCACGALSGEEHARETCERCGVLCSTPALRERRYGHVQVVGVLHPALAPLVADVLRLSADQVRAIARCEAWLDGDTVRPADEMDTHENHGATGLSALSAALVRAGADPALVAVLITRAVPLPPPGQRPFYADLGPAMVDPWIGPLNEAWLAFVLAAQSQLHLVELAPPPVILMSRQRVVQDLFETVVHATVSPPAAIRPWPEPKPISSPVRLVGMPGRLPEDVGTDVRGLFFVDDVRLFVQRPHGSWLVTTGGDVLAHVPTCGRLATSVHGARLRMAAWMRDAWDWFDKDEYWDAVSGRASVAVLDLDTNAYLDTYPADMPLRLLEHDQPEDLVVGSIAGDASNGSDDGASPATRARPAPLRWGGDRPAVLASTRDGRFAWVGEQESTAVLDLDTGIPQLDPVMPSEISAEDPAVCISSEAPFDEAYAGEMATAMGLTPQNRFRILHGTGVVSDGEKLLFRIDARILAAAFSPAADRIAIATDEEIVLISVSDAPAVLGRFAAPDAQPPSLA